MLDRLGDVLKKIVMLGLCLIVFVWVVRDPAKAGDIISNIIHFIGGLANSGGTILDHATQ